MRRVVAACGLAIAAATAPAYAASESVYGRPAAYVRVDGRWARDVELPLKAGEAISRENVSESLHALRNAITADPFPGYGGRSAGEIGVLYINVEFDERPAGAEPAAPGAVGVVFRPRYLRLSLQRVGDNVLPIPRSSQATLLANVPKPLLALDPSVTASHDRRLGAALALAVENETRLGEGNTRLGLRARVLQAAREGYHRANLGVRYGERRTGSTLQEYFLRAEADDDKEPLGSGEHARESGALGVGVTFKVAPTARLSLDTGYRHSRESVALGALNARTETKTNEQTNRVLFEMLPPPVFGFLRAVVWEDHAWQAGPGGSYQRLAGRVGYAKEIATSPNHTFGVEVIAGAGKAWGATPEHARFFGGNPMGQFLYDAPAAAALVRMPAGPLVRSFGERQAGFRFADGTVRGGSAYWHVNATLTIPIRRWSYPLIPDEPVFEGGPTIKQVMKGQIDVSGTSFLAATLKREGLSEDEAKRRAERVIAEIRPAAHFIIDDANLYSVKPMLMLDAAGLSEGNGSHATWLAAGAGIQLTVVTAKFEGGYMRTLTGPTSGSRGNLFFRIVFQNLF